MIQLELMSRCVYSPEKREKYHKTTAFKAATTPNKSTQSQLNTINCSLKRMKSILAETFWV